MPRSNTFPLNTYTQIYINIHKHRYNFHCEWLGLWDICWVHLVRGCDSVHSRCLSGQQGCGAYVWLQHQELMTGVSGAIHRHWLWDLRHTVAVSFSTQCYTIQYHRLFSPKVKSSCITHKMPQGPWAKTMPWIGLPLLKAGLIQAVFPNALLICAIGILSPSPVRGCFVWAGPAQLGRAW